MLPDSLQLSLAQPAWLTALLVLPLVYAATRRSLAGLSLGRQRCWLALRTLAILALVLALAGPLVSGRPRPVHPVFLIDASASITPAAREAASEFVRRAEDASRGRRSDVVYFAATSVAADESGGRPASDQNATDIASAVEKACAFAVPDTALHVVLLSDGVPTQGNVSHAIDEAVRAGVPVSTVPLASCEPEVYVGELRVPRVVRACEPFDVEATLCATQDDDGSVEWTTASGSVAKQRVRVQKGECRVRFRTTFEEGPAQRLGVRIRDFQDTLAGNNLAETQVAVRPRPRVLLVENRPGASVHLFKALRAGGLVPETVSPRELPDTASGFERFDAVISINVPAAAMTQRQMDFLKTYVHQGGGLVVVGGDQAFTPGGYRRSVLEEILPLESESSRQTPRPGLALVLVVDRSLSMEEGGAIDLAREAMRRAVELLQPEDQLGVLAFDEESRWVSPIEAVGDKSKVLKQIASITAGGRTDTGPALQKAHLALREAFASQKHIIVLTDGISHPADFEALAERIVRDGMTISTVALGKEVSRPLLQDLARIGKGRYYACDRPNSVPSVFALETASATRSGIREEPFYARPRKCQESSSLDRCDLSAAPTLLGYTETRAKPEARVVLTAATGDPLLAWFRSGKGTSVAFTSDVEDRWAAAWLTWPGFGRFWMHVVRGVLQPDPVDQTSLASAAQSPEAATRWYPDEFRVRPTDRDMLRHIASTTGGVFEPKPEAVWQVSSPGALPPLPLHHYFLAAAAVLFVLDTAARRW